MLEGRPLGVEEDPCLEVAEVEEDPCPEVAGVEEDPCPEVAVVEEDPNPEHLEEAEEGVEQSCRK